MYWFAMLSHLVTILQNYLEKWLRKGLLRLKVFTKVKLKGNYTKRNTDGLDYEDKENLKKIGYIS